MSASAPSSATAVEDTRRWLERAVIGLNLCPFAKAVHVRQQVHFAACEAGDFAPVLEALDAEVSALLALPPRARDTTLLVLTGGFDDFLLFNELVRQGERLLARRRLDGVLQLASFHPAFVFGSAGEDDAANRTNRSPWPTLHLLREDSLDRAVAAFPDAASIYEANIRTMERLGSEGWRRLGVQRS